MMADARTRLGVAWAALALITLAYLVIDHTTDHDGTLAPSTAVTIGAIVLALVKMRIIFGEFMDVRNAPPLLRRATDLWVLIMGTILLGTYLVGQSLH